ncbi:GNAT superfamily N-acetyltransferase [Symbiobacterium terraclitae]|uniref:GNAT superfamily N-acetyltransferase n=1 Tax=Symbiobacterium terraclitae TaxID=557451 RepID=A0ABS4JXG3_9FIRM|nr:GNAT superfamily N-acetyltransferase [Symbiobacterium terraclitae]
MDPYLPPAAFAPNIAARELILVEQGEQAIGYLRLAYIWGKIPYIGLIWLEPAHRGQGIGTDVLEFVEAYLREQGFRGERARAAGVAPGRRLPRVRHHRRDQRRRHRRGPRRARLRPARAKRRMCVLHMRLRVFEPS